MQLRDMQALSPPTLFLPYPPARCLPVPQAARDAASASQLSALQAALQRRDDELAAARAAADKLRQELDAERQGGPGWAEFA